MSDLRIPVAFDFDENRIYPPAALPKQDYLCGSCKATVRVRREHDRKTGPVQRHFFHLKSDEEDPRQLHCEFKKGGESLDHWEAKQKILNFFNAGQEVRVDRVCKTCGKTRPSRIFPNPQLISATDEFTLKLDGKQFRADVALLNSEGVPLIVLEVKHTHAVGEQKATALNAADLCWGEFEAIDIKNDIWKPTQGLTYTLCPRCKQVEEYGKTFPFDSDKSLYVDCPVNRSANVTTHCPQCVYFESVSHSGIFCTGECHNASL